MLVLITAAVFLMALPLTGSAAEVVVPNDLENVEGNGNNTLPWNCGNFLSQRYQQVYLGSEVGSGTITQIAFRSNGGTFGPTILHGVTITLSSTTNGPDALNTTFASNVGADVKTVFSGDLVLSAASVGPFPGPFEIAIPLQHVFPFAAVAGTHLLLDVTIPACVIDGPFQAAAFDSHNAQGDSVSRVYDVAVAGRVNNDTSGLVTRFTIEPAGPPPPPTTLVAAVLPYSRSVQVNTPATAYATISNAGPNTAFSVGISLASPIQANFKYNQTSCQTNDVIGGDDVPATVPPAPVPPVYPPINLACYVITVTPTLPLDPIDVTFTFKGTNTPAVATLVGINTFLLSSGVAPTPDIVALVATLPPDPGIVNVPLGATGVFVVAVSNVGIAGTVTATLDTGAAVLPLSLAICETDAVGNCKSPPATTVVSLIPGKLDDPPLSQAGTATYGIFITSTGGPVSFDAAVNRIFVRFKDSGGVTRGATSVAVRTQ